MAKQYTTFISLFVLNVFVAVNCVPAFTKCKLTDDECVLKSANEALPQIMLGDPSLGVESSDPLHFDTIVSDVAGLKYNFSDVTVLGFKDCKVIAAKFNIKQSTFHYEIACPFNIYGDYDLRGRLLVLPVEGTGKFKIDAKKLWFSVDAETETTTGEDGKTHLKIKKFNFKSDAQDQVKFSFENLFNGNKELSDGVHKFANDNYKDVTQEVGSPLFNANLKKVTKNVNRFLKAVPLEDLIL